MERSAICQLKIRQRDLHERVKEAVEIALGSAELSAYPAKYQTRKLCLLTAKSRFKPIQHFLDLIAPLLNQGPQAMTASVMHRIMSCSRNLGRAFAVLRQIPADLQAGIPSLPPLRLLRQSGRRGSQGIGEQDLFKKSLP